jgi:hypothetical protein
MCENGAERRQMHRTNPSRNRGSNLKFLQVFGSGSILIDANCVDPELLAPSVPMSQSLERNSQVLCHDQMTLSNKDGCLPARVSPSIRKRLVGEFSIKVNRLDNKINGIISLRGTSCSSLVWDGLVSRVYLCVGVLLAIDERRDA